jgi:DNA-binding GntR family transcriptional regulator
MMEAARPGIRLEGVTEVVWKYLRDRIITGAIKPGEHLNEKVIAENLAVSTPPLREALRRLENERLVTCIPRKGCFAAELSIADLEAVCEVREMIECFTLDLLRKKDIRDLPLAREALERSTTLQVPVSSDSDADILQYLREFTGFHEKLIEAAGNPHLIDLYRVVSTNLTRYQIIYLSAPGSTQHSVHNHREILNHIKTGDYNAAKELVRRHLEFVRTLLITHFVEDESAE